MCNALYLTTCFTLSFLARTASRRGGGGEGWFVLSFRKRERATWRTLRIELVRNSEGRWRVLTKRNGVVIRRKFPFCVLSCYSVWPGNVGRRTCAQFGQAEIYAQLGGSFLSNHVSSIGHQRKLTQVSLSHCQRIVITVFSVSFDEITCCKLMMSKVQLLVRPFSHSSQVCALHLIHLYVNKIKAFSLTTV